MLQDLRFAMNRHRGYAATAILTVALGVGANTAVFSVADSVLFRPLPFADVDRLWQASLPIGAGLAGGLVLAVWASRYVASLLFGIVPLDALSFAAAAGIVLVSGLAAALIPARRAGRVDPIAALRAE